MEKESKKIDDNLVRDVDDLDISDDENISSNESQKNLGNKGSDIFDDETSNNEDLSDESLKEDKGDIKSQESQKDESRKEDSKKEEAENSLEKLQNENETLKDNVLRVQAEFQNYKRRTEKEKTDIYKFANERIILELLGLMDNFDRAIESMANEEQSQKSVLEGVGMMRKSLYELLQREGVQKIEALGEEFDPNLHHAVMTEQKDGCDSDIVIEEFQVGYKLGDKVIRPSMVKVSC